MAFKFPFTNYHELNLTWVLDQLKQLFEQSSENVTVIENYNGRLTAVETELPLVSETAQDAAQTAANAASLAQTAKSTADTAQENAIQAQGLAGQARQEAQAAQRAADAATQAAQQAQSVAQNFDGRITEAQNNASEALEASRSFENRVQSAITTANNAAQTATNAQGIATRADQNAALALDTLNSQRSELERIGAEQVELITEETENGKTEIENLAQSVLDSIPADYTALAALVDKKAPVIINNASGSIASFDDGADDMKIQRLIVNIEPQEGSGWTGVEIKNNYVINIMEHGYFGDDYDTYWNVYSGTGSVKDGVLTVSNAVGRNGVQLRGNYPVLINSHKYLRSFSYKSDVVITSYMCGVKTLGSTADFRLEEDIITNAASASATFDTFPNNVGTVGTFSIKNIMLIDLTAMFGEEKEPSTVAEFRSMFPDEYYPYNDGTQPIVGKEKKIYVTFPIESGTVYSGTLTLNPDGTGVLVVDGDPPQTYQIPAEQISGILSTVYGANAIWSDVGPVSVDYPADTKLYIDGKLAELQATILENI